MRTRTRTTSYGSTAAGPWTGRHVNTSDGSVVSNNSGNSSPVSLGSYTEIITDQSTGRSGVGRVEHSKVDFKVRPCMMGSWHYNTQSRRVDILSGNYSMWNDIGAAPAVLPLNKFPVVWTKTKEQLMTEACEKFNDVNETDNLLNLIEANQTVSTISSFIDLARRALNPRSWFLFSKGPKGIRGKQLSLSDVSNAHLGWSFGLAPLISDLQKIQRDLPRLRKNLAELAKNQAKLRRVTAQCTGEISLDYALLGSAYSVSTSQSGYLDVRILPTFSPIRIAGIYGTRTITYETSAFQQADYLMSRYIATGPAKLIWERIPFSFALDWVVNLTPLIDVLDNSLVGNGRSIKKSWYSEKYAFILPVFKHKSGTNDWPDDGGQVALGDYSYYHRESLDPDPMIGLAGKFGKKQLGLTASLLHQKVANLRRR